MSAVPWIWVLPASLRGLQRRVSWRRVTALGQPVLGNPGVAQFLGRDAGDHTMPHPTRQ